jgi:hypothetical protein
MNGVTTAIVLFILAALAFPGLVKRKHHYYASLGAVLVIILLDALAHVAKSDGFSAFAYFLSAVLQVFCIGMLVMSSGGLSVKEFGEEITNTIEVIRRGEEGKEVIIPLSEEAKATIRANAEARRNAPPQPPPPEPPKDPLPLV